MKTRSAVLFTSRFPFGTSEFLEAEVEHLCEAFEEVRLVPFTIQGQVQSVPSNAVVDTGLARIARSGTGRFQWTVRQAKRSVSLLYGLTDARYRNELTAFGFPPRRGWATAVSLAWAHASAVSTWARTVPPPELAYSFWLGPATRAMREAWPGATVIARGHGGDIDGLQHGLQRLPFVCESLDASNRVFSVSQWGMDLLIDTCPTARNRVDVMRLGSVDVGGLSARSQDGVLRILSVSHVDANKRVGLIAAAAGTIARSGRPVYWRHIGDGPGLEGVRRQLRHQRPTLLSARLDGAVPLDQVLETMRRGPWDVFVNASRYEGAPVSVMEAQSAGIPCVVTAVCGTTEIVDGHTDIHVPREVDATTLAEAIRLAAATPPDWAVIRRARWQRKYDRKRNAKKFVGIVSELVESSRAQQ